MVYKSRLVVFLLATHVCYCDNGGGGGSVASVPQYITGDITNGVPVQGVSVWGNLCLWICCLWGYDESLYVSSGVSGLVSVHGSVSIDVDAVLNYK